jgi:uncharacterized protein (DUF1778 family)
MGSTSANRTEKLDLRLTSSAKEKILSAAAAEERTVTDYILRAALRAADETLADRRHFGLNAEQWSAFLAALDAPERHHPRMERLLQQSSVFEQ